MCICSQYAADSQALFSQNNLSRCSSFALQARIQGQHVHQLHQVPNSAWSLFICRYVFIPCFALSQTCLKKVLKMINAFSLHFKHKQPAHYSSYTFHDALIIATALDKTLVYLIFWSVCE